MTRSLPSARTAVNAAPAKRSATGRKPVTARKPVATRRPATARGRLAARSRSLLGRTDRVRRVPRPQAPAVFWLILAIVGLLCLVGLVMVLSASSVTADRTYGTALYFFKRQAQWLAIGAVALFFASRFDYHRLAKLAPAGFLLSALTLVVVLFDTPFTKSVNGSSRWFEIAGTSFQPSEFAKFAVILWIAGLLHRRRNEMGDWRRTILPVAAGLAAFSGLIILEPDLGTVVMLVAIAGVMLLVAGARFDILAALGTLAGLVLLGVSQLGYHRARWDSLDPWKDKLGAGWQSLQSQVGIASGGLLGVGPGASKAKWGFLPEAHTDFIFSIIGEELGLLGCLAVIAAFAVLLGAGIRIARGAPDRFGSLLAIGISTWIGVQAFVNIGVALGALPNKGMTLPFVSYGGTSLLITLFTTGVLLNIARQST